MQPVNLVDMFGGHSRGWLGNVGVPAGNVAKIQSAPSGNRAGTLRFLRDDVL